MFLEASFQYERMPGVATNQAILSLYEMQAVSPNEVWAQELMEMLGLTTWSKVVVGELMMGGQYTLSLHNSTTINEQQYLANRDNVEQLYYMLGIRLISQIPVFELLNGAAPAAPAAPPPVPNWLTDFRDRIGQALYNDIVRAVNTTPGAESITFYTGNTVTAGEFISADNPTQERLASIAPQANGTFARTA